MITNNDKFYFLGDTLYATDHELIDWYPQSKCLK